MSHRRGVARRSRAGTALVVVVLALIAVPAGVPPMAGAGGLDYRCRLGVTKLGPQITVTFRLRTNQPRHDWRVRLFHEGEPIFSKVRTTNASGRIKVVRVVPNLAGRDDLDARARHRETGRVCEVSSRI